MIFSIWSKSALISDHSNSGNAKQLFNFIHSSDILFKRHKESSLTRITLKSKPIQNGFLIPFPKNCFLYG
ncbi:hypothetical protein LEP1GSC186_2880 [Leptospira noguchii serovar Autumnalis str. ZUN142]|uniref:Uncharacterized protein n=1 Tax=Leptospira noguchii serovar Autumnalis str. ZUN142 TaxID=1085540 RepID=M6U1A5_9LEPT|nr:hypothetical protein LEP1GSC186_2880 [Leptospira noguchii serovar Autumnalis str. ZUN142]